MRLLWILCGLGLVLPASAMAAGGPISPQQGGVGASAPGGDVTYIALGAGQRTVVESVRRRAGRLRSQRFDQPELRQLRHHVGQYVPPDERWQRRPAARADGRDARCSPRRCKPGATTDPARPNSGQVLDAAAPAHAEARDRSAWRRCATPSLAHLSRREELADEYAERRRGVGVKRNSSPPSTRRSASAAKGAISTTVRAATRPWSAKVQATPLDLASGVTSARRGTMQGIDPENLVRRAEHDAGTARAERKMQASLDAAAAERRNRSHATGRRRSRTSGNAFDLHRAGVTERNGACRCPCASRG